MYKAPHEYQISSQPVVFNTAAVFLCQATDALPSENNI
jgi:hypothetical protein